MYIIILQFDGAGNCLFASLKKSLSVHTATLQQATYFPNRYFRRMVVCFMANHLQLMIKNKFLSLMSNYGVEVEAVAGQVRGWTPPLSFRQYCICCSKEIFGAMKQFCLQFRVCGVLRLLYSTPRPCRSTGSSMIERWRRQM